jgi:phage repressor protein C with HTH and peptisase S24 domain
MKTDDKAKGQGERLAEARKKRGFSDAKAAAVYFGWNYNTYSQHERGERGLRKDAAERYSRAFRVPVAWLMLGEGSISSAKAVPIMGRIGAGAEIQPESEQVPPEGLFEVEFSLPLPDGMVGFEVVGDSMYPRYDDGDVVICSSEGIPPSNLEPGQEAAVRTSDGRRFLKRVRPGAKGFTLESHNAPPIHDIKLEWASEVVTVVRQRKWKRLNGAAASIRGKLR